MAATGVLDVDLAVGAGEAQRVPLLLLPAIFSSPSEADDLAPNVIGEPLGDLAELLHGADTGFLIKLAQRGLVGILALVDAALRHLPDMRGFFFIDPSTTEIYTLSLHDALPI